MKMKRILFAAAAALAALTGLSAQEKGDMYISGNLDISSTGTRTSAGSIVTKTPSSFGFGIAPEFGYFITDRLEVNLGLGYELDRTHRGTDSNGNNLFNVSNVFTISPGVRYYVPLGEKFYYTPGFDLSVGFGGSRREIDPQTSVKGGITRFGIVLSALAFEFRPAEHFGITFRAGNLSYSLNHTSSKGATKSTDNTGTFRFNLNTGAGIGFKYYF